MCEKRDKRQKNRLYFAFTLAEVLVTLGIIGIVAAMTIPTLMQNSQDAQTKSAIKEAYRTLSQAITQVSNDNGGTIAGICTDYDDLCFKNLFKPYFSYVKDCDNNSVANGCWMATSWMDGTTFTGVVLPSIVLKNGMFVMFRYHTKACDYTDAASSNYLCGWLAVDVNGFKAPNRFGKDVFTFEIQPNSIKPGGSIGDTGNYLTCNSTDTGLQSGWGCTSKYLYGN